MMLTFGFFGSVLAASLVGSPHCVGMCGGLVAAVSSRGSWFEVLSYHGFRIFGYVALGAVFGFAGEKINDLGVWAGLQAAAPGLIAGMLLIQFGATLGLWKFSWALPEWVSPRWFKKAAGMRASACAGLLTAGLPCGWLYSFILLAVGTGHAVAGAGVMLAFGLGTLPILVASGLALRSALLRRRLTSRPVTAGLLLIAAGVSLFQHTRTTPASHERSCHAESNQKVD